METKRTILLMDSSPDSQKAADLLTMARVPYEILKADKFWREIEWPIPSLFLKGDTWRGLEEIEVVIGVLNEPEGPN